MFISVIVPALPFGGTSPPGEPFPLRERSADLIEQMAAQVDDFEVLIVGTGDAGDVDMVEVDDKCRWMRVNGGKYLALNTAAAEARGDILLFLQPANHLSATALQTIGQNFQLLPQTIGGSFHLKFNASSLPLKAMARLLKWLRYRGCYYNGSGLFVRKQVFEALQGFDSESPLPDFDFTQRLEQHGPTLYLPAAVIGPAPSFREVVTWLVAPTLYKFPITWPLLKAIQVDTYGS